VDSWPDLGCTGETAAGDTYCYINPEVKRVQVKTSVLIVLHERIVPL